MNTYIWWFRILHCTSLIHSFNLFLSTDGFFYYWFQKQFIQNIQKLAPPQPPRGVGGGGDKREGAETWSAKVEVGRTGIRTDVKQNLIFISIIRANPAYIDDVIW
jgi:hypothetical protein